MNIQQYQIYLVNLDPTIGSEINKTRPCVIISPNEMNKYLQTIVIAPVTNTSKNYPTRISLSNLKITGWIVLDQIRTIDRKRIIKLLDNLEEDQIQSIKSIMKETYVD